MKYCLLRRIENPYMSPFIYAEYYDIDMNINLIFTDKTTYFHWLPKDLINIIKSYLYDIQEGDMIYYKYGNCYAKIVAISSFGESIQNISSYDSNYTYGEYKDIKKMFEDSSIKIYRKRLERLERLEPSCNII